ncbi:ABC transporter permease [Halomarina salina]|uniref:ABC transporter permease n=1 Tax=Halomarina salina TaxID=1872699 RepID=A0ABD5RHX3_9EURY|nr:ABC transporter permease [Halomarina salina]
MSAPTETDGRSTPASERSTDDTAPTASDERAGLWTLVRAVAYKKYLLLRRYPVNTVSQLVTLYLFFAVLFFGGQALAGAAITDSIEGLIVGYMLWSMSIAAYGGLSWAVMREAQWGTLEQLYMSPYGFGTVMAVRTFVNVVEALTWGVLILASMLLTTGETLSLDPLTVVPLVALTLAPVVGIGFVFGGLALVYKRIESMFQLVQFVLIGLIAAPVSVSPVVPYLPLAQGSHLLQRAMADGVHLWQFSATDLAILVGTGVGYLVVGYLAFLRASTVARRRGVLGHY